MKRVGMGVGMGAVVGTAAWLRRRRVQASASVTPDLQKAAEAPSPKPARGHNGTAPGASQPVRQAHR